MRLSGYIFTHTLTHTSHISQSLREEGVDRVTELSNLINGTYTKYVQNKENEAAEAEAKAKVLYIST